MLHRLRLAAAMWWVWRRCDWVYRWAHHPLCERFGRDVWRIGPVHVCRSCTLLYASAFVGVGTGWFMAGRVSAWGLLWGLMVLVLPLSHPRLYEKQSRFARDLLRCGAGLIAGLLLVMILRGGAVVGAAHVVLLGAVYGWYRRSRQRVLASACEGCPELGARGTCSGFRLQSERILAYEPMATELIMRSGWRPPLPAVASDAAARMRGPAVDLRVQAVRPPSGGHSTSPEPSALRGS